MELLLIVNLSDKLNFEKWAEVYDGDKKKSHFYQTVFTAK